jgi:hypothetical protein
MGTPPRGGLEHRASNPVSVKNLTAIETSTIVKLRPYVPVGMKRTSSSNNTTQYWYECMWHWYIHTNWHSQGVTIVPTTSACYSWHF